MLINTNRNLTKLTIILPLYNSGSINCIDLKTKLDFLLNHSLFNYQLIVILNDCDQSIENLLVASLFSNKWKNSDYCKSVFILNFSSDEEINIYHNLKPYIIGEYLQIINPCVIFNKKYFYFLNQFFEEDQSRYDLIEFSSLIKTKTITFSFDTSHRIYNEKKQLNNFKHHLLIVISPFISNKLFKVSFLHKYQLLHHFYNNEQKFFFIYCVLKLSETFKIVLKTLVIHNFLYSQKDLIKLQKFSKKIYKLEQFIKYFIYTGELYIYQQEIEYMIIRYLLAFLLVYFSVCYTKGLKTQIYPLKIKNDIEALNIFINSYFPNYSNNYYIKKYLDRELFSNNFLTFKHFSQLFEKIYQASLINNE